MTPPRAPGRPVRENRANGKPDAFDLDAYQAEALHEPFRFTLGGHRFELPHLLDMDWHVSANGETIVADMVRAGLGSQWARFDASELSAGGYNELWKRWKDHSGAEPGESSASPGS
jgi:hypothetical protein